MKQTITLALFLICGSCFAQKVDRGVKSIFVTIDTTAGRKEVINQVAKYLLINNYEIDLINSELGLVQTKDAILKYVHWKHRLSAALIGNKLRFSGKVTINDVSKDIENRGSLGSLQVHAFRRLQEISTGFPHESIEYH